MNKQLLKLIDALIKSAPIAVVELGDLSDANIIEELNNRYDLNISNEEQMKIVDELTKLNKGDN